MDAAQVGKGLGDTLGAILFKVPEMKRQHDLEQRRIDLEERRIKSDEKMSDIHGQLYQAQTQNIPLMAKLKEELGSVYNRIEYCQSWKWHNKKLTVRKLFARSKWKSWHRRFNLIQ
jgi:hypothetical protein